MQKEHIGIERALAMTAHHKPSSLFWEATYWTLFESRKEIFVAVAGNESFYPDRLGVDFKRLVPSFDGESPEKSCGGVQDSFAKLRKITSGCDGEVKVLFESSLYAVVAVGKSPALA